MPVLPTPDKELLLQLQRGNRKALSAVYDSYSPAIYRYLYRRIGDATIAEDLTGTVFLKVLEAIGKHQTWSDSFVGWLYRIAHNVAIDHFRKSGRQQEDELAETVESHWLSPDGKAEREARLRQIRSALTHLTADQAQVILLRFGDGMSHQEVAAILGKSEGAIKLLQHRALQGLRQILVEEEL